MLDCKVANVTVATLHTNCVKEVLPTNTTAATVENEECVSEQFLNSTSAQYRLYSAKQIKFLKKDIMSI